MTYAAALQIFTNSVDAGQARNSVLNDLRSMGLTPTQIWAIANRSPKHFG